MLFWKNGHRTSVAFHDAPDLHGFNPGMAGSCQAKNPQSFVDTCDGWHSTGLC